MLTFGIVKKKESKRRANG